MEKYVGVQEKKPVMFCQTCTVMPAGSGPCLGMDNKPESVILGKQCGQ